MAKDSHVNARGNSRDRARRKEWLCQKFGDGRGAWCWECGDYVPKAQLVADRIVPGHLGGSYRRENIRPQCPTDSRKQGYQYGIGRTLGSVINPANLVSA